MGEGARKRDQSNSQTIVNLSRVQKGGGDTEGEAIGGNRMSQEERRRPEATRGERRRKVQRHKGTLVVLVGLHHGFYHYLFERAPTALLLACVAKGSGVKVLADVGWENGVA